MTRWEARRWDTDGRVCLESGDDDGEPHEILRRVRARFAPPIWIDFGTGRHGYHPDYPAGVPALEEVRTRVREGATARSLVDELRGLGATPIEIMTVIADAFERDYDELDDVPPALAGDEAAAARLDARIRERQHRWDRPRRLRLARERGESVVDVLHADSEHEGNSIPLFKSLREAFPLAFGDAKQLIELACHRDPSFDTALDEAIAKENARRRR